ncbi:MAG: hypothetical protein SH817_01325 [Leptospira sp.]|nr:hypothetical protein [Leptospira sp.]
MKVNTMKKLGLILMVSTSLLALASCKSEKKEDNTALLYLINDRTVPDSDQALCLTAYGLANSCVAGSTQQFNPGVGCGKATLGALSTTNGTVTEQMTALKACVEAAVKDPVQPCNLPQFSYAAASQAAAGVFKTKCSVAEYAIAPATAKTKQDLTGLLKY